MTTKIKITLKKNMDHANINFPKENADNCEIVDKYIPILLDRYIEGINIFSRINERLVNNKKIRNENFPSHISENIVKIVLNKNYYQHSSKKVTWNTNVGDLEFNGLKYEVKAFMSHGPSSFGPTENWDKIFFLDGMKISEKQITIYEINLSSNDSMWEKIKVNSTETYKDQCVQG